MSDLAFEINDLDKIYQTSSNRQVEALKKINLSVQQGEFISIIGPSGCGKSTLLKILSNLDKSTSGEIKWNVSSENIGFVFQDSVLLPWKTVYENVIFPLEVKKIKTPENLQNVEHLLALAGLENFKNAYPRELSGGMKQRVSIVRALSYNPDVLLMDEPFGALDALTRDKMGIELMRIWSETKKTILFVTHSISESVFLSDRVVLMSPRPGKIDEVTEINLPRPRSVDVKDSIEFVQYVKKLREGLGE